MSRQTVAELDFAIAVGAYAGPPGLQGQQLFASAKLAGLHDVFLRSDDSTARYFYVEQINFLEADVTDEDSWEAECVLHPVDPAVTPAKAKKIALASGASSSHSVVGLLLTGVDRARERQAETDASRTKIHATEPWLLDPNYAGDYETAMWAHDVGGRYDDFPVKILDREFPPMLPMFAALRRPAGWPRALTFLAGPLTAPVPSFDGPAATVLVYEVIAGEGDSEACAAIMRGERKPVAELLVGSRELIREISSP